MSTQYTPVTIPDTEVRLFRSSIVDDMYRLLIYLPADYRESDTTYPVIYATDGNWFFPLLVSIVYGTVPTQETPPLIIVGIGYDTEDGTEQFQTRRRDLTPTQNPNMDKEMAKQFPQKTVLTGQGASFLRFIREELKPFMNTSYRTNPDDSIYAGDSLGGLFGLHALFHQPDTFTRYVIGSPFINYDNGITLTYESNYAANHDDLQARLFMSVGAREESDDPFTNPADQYVTNMRKLAETLKARDYPNLQFTSHVFEGETHMSVVPATYSRGLREVFRQTV